MKKYIRDIILFTILALFFIFIVSNNYYVTNMVYYSINLWAKRIIPVLLPTFLIIDLFYNSNIPYLIQKYLHINPFYIISIVAGSPTNAYILKKHNNIEKALASTKYTGFIFTFISLKNIFETRIVFLLITFNIIANIVLFFIIKPEKVTIIKKQQNIINCFLLSLKNGMVVLINILGLIIFFNILPINYIDSSFIKCLLYSLCEVTTSFNYLSYSNLSFPVKLLFSIISMSTCGLCISMQIKSIISDTSFNYRLYLKYRLIHLVLFLLLGLLLLI